MKLRCVNAEDCYGELQVGYEYIVRPLRDFSAVKDGQIVDWYVDIGNGNSYLLSRFIRVE